MRFLMIYRCLLLSGIFLLAGCAKDENPAASPNNGTPVAAPVESLQVYYPFSGNTMDSSGKAFAGTNSGALLATDKNGTADAAYLFNGTSSIITFNDSLHVSDNSFTLSVWFYFTLDPLTLTASRAYLLDWPGVLRLWYSPDIQPPLPATGVTTADQLFFDIWDWQGVPTRNRVWKDSTWYHVAANYDGDTARIFVNGVLNNSAAIAKTLHPVSAPLTVGASTTGWLSNEFFFPGKLDQIRVYNRALSSAEITRLYQAY